MNKYQLPTPAILIDIDILEKNIKSMADTAKEAGIKLRPHIKTHKMTSIAKMQMEAGAIGITCAKVSEAEVMAGSGIRDILIAYPVIGESQINSIMDLLDTCRVTIGFDSFFGAKRINEAAKKKKIIADLFMIINTGLNRDGVASGEEALELANNISTLTNIRVRGIMTHEGHVYHSKSSDELTKAVVEAGLKMVETAELLRNHGFPIEEVSMGSTPACRAAVVVDGITEWRPGTYVFNDVHEVLLATPSEECALSILSTIVSHPDSTRCILDAGSKTMTSERSITKGYGYIKQAPSALIERLSEEHGIVTLAGDEELMLGQVVEIIPNHVCPVINLMDSVYVLRGDEVIATWNVEARGKVI